jgi:hypothetical protein
MIWILSMSSPARTEDVDLCLPRKSDGSAYVFQLVETDEAQALKIRSIVSRAQH